MKILYARGVTQAPGESLNLSWLGFINFIIDSSKSRKRESEDAKRDNMWFSCAEYKSNHRRRENLQRVWALVADLDGVKDSAAVKKAISDYEYVAWTTWNSTEESPRWRVVFPLEGPVSPEQFDRIAKRFLKRFDKKICKLDPRSFLPEQLWFDATHKYSSREMHQVWHNTGRTIKVPLTVDFTDTKIPGRPQEITKGGRNNALVLRLNEPDALMCDSPAELRRIAYRWNRKLPQPMDRKEVDDTVKKKWRWFQSGEGLERRLAYKGEKRQKKINGMHVPDFGVGLMSQAVMTAKMPPSLVGDFMYPGATMVSAKMKEGKSYLTMQLAIAIATKTPFLTSRSHPGFSVREKQKTLIIAGEDTAAGIAHRFKGNLAIGNLATPGQEHDVRLVFNEHLDDMRRYFDSQTGPKNRMSGFEIFERLVAKWYRDGYRLICVDPLRVLEGALGMVSYPGVEPGMNAHARDFHTARFYSRVALNYPDLYITVSLHHGKNKRDHDSQDPGDMIAGTSGFGAGVVSTISILPSPTSLDADEDKDGNSPRRRELYLHGRYTPEERYLIEQGPTGLWGVIGKIKEELLSKVRQDCLQTMIRIGAKDNWVSAEAISAATGGKTKADTIRKVLSRVTKSGMPFGGFRLLVKRGDKGGYRLVTI